MKCSLFESNFYEFFAVEYMLQKLGMKESEVPELCTSLYKDYGTTMAGLKVG